MISFTLSLFATVLTQTIPRWFRPLLCGAGLGLTLLAPVWADIRIPRTTVTIEIDGELNESSWQQASPIELLYDTWPAENSPAPVKTTAYVMEDGEYFYVAFIAKDPDPTAIRAFYRDRDKVWDDDSVGIKIDTYHDSKLAYQFFINPLGVQADSIENEITKMESDAWDGIWHSAGKITAEGYQVEVAIPLRMLNFNEQQSLQKWKLELLRFYPRDVRHRLSSNQISRQDPCWICQMSTATGFAGAKSGNNLAIVPALVAGAEQQRTLSRDGHSDWRSENNLEPSLDLKWGITPDINFNATLNPDFSQVEADEAQVSVNDTFALFFNEKRSFFLDNADYFASPLDLVYTRNVSSPDAGVRLTGRQQQHSFAFFAANDKTTTFIVPGNVSSDIAFLDEKSENAVLRYRHDLNQGLSLGMISTLRQSEHYHNHVTGADLKYQLDAQNKVIAQWLYSDSAYPQHLQQQLSAEARLRTQGDGLTDQAQYLAYQHENRDWSWYSRYQAMGQDFRADLGYLPQTDWTKQTHGGSYQWFYQQQWLSRFKIEGDWDISHNSDGELLEKEAELELQWEGQQQSNGFVGATRRDRVGSRLDQNILRIDANTALFAEKLFSAGAEFQPLAGLFLGVEAETGDTLDFRNNRLGDGLELVPELKWHLNRHLQLQARHTYRTLDAANTEVFTANLTDLRLSYQFSVRSFVRLALIYADIRHNPLNNIGEVTAHQKTLGSQLLYSYKLNPQTLFFAGYSDNALSSDEIQQLTRDRRSVFLKFSYAFAL